MSPGGIILEQLADPFRIGLLIALVATMRRTEAVTGRWVPLALGAAFVALIVPLTAGAGGPGPLWREVALGLAANAAILAVLLVLWRLGRRWLP